MKTASHPDTDEYEPQKPVTSFDEISEEVVIQSMWLGILWGMIGGGIAGFFTVCTMIGGPSISIFPSAVGWGAVLGLFGGIILGLINGLVLRFFALRSFSSGYVIHFRPQAVKISLVTTTICWTVFIFSPESYMILFWGAPASLIGAWFAANKIGKWIDKQMAQTDAVESD